MQTVFSWARAVQASDLPPNAKLVLLNLRLYVNDVGTFAYPSLTRQVKDTGLTRPTLIKYLRIAENAGFLEIERKYVDGQWWRNQYILKFPNDMQLGGKATLLDGKPPLPEVVKLFNDDGKAALQDVVKPVYTKSPIEDSKEESIIKGNGFGEESKFSASEFKPKKNASPPKSPPLVSECVGSGIAGTWQLD